MHRRSGCATLSQLAFPGESNPKFPWGINPIGTTQFNLPFRSSVRCTGGKCSTLIAQEIIVVLILILQVLNVNTLLHCNLSTFSFVFQIQEKYDVNLEQEARVWIEKILGIELVPVSAMLLDGFIVTLVD